ncbi:DUF4354 family protein [Proteus mirabilis]|nr:DUF4354 family protein [Proteus mirabilis]MBG6049406.1 DUF4354 family protein [Proteus mirabilis]
MIRLIILSIYLKYAGHNTNKLQQLVLIISALSSFSAISSNIAENLIIEVKSSTESTVVIYGVPKYQKSFDIIVMSKSQKPLNLIKDIGCYKAFDSKENKFSARTINTSLLDGITNKYSS